MDHGHAADAANAQADATHAQDILTFLATQERDALAMLSDQSQARQAALATLTQVLETNDETRTDAANFRIRG